jgi:hypothetical protein
VNKPDAGTAGIFWPFQNICKLWAYRHASASQNRILNALLGSYGGAMASVHGIRHSFEYFVLNKKYPN